jgi:hypothetical protein
VNYPNATRAERELIAHAILRCIHRTGYMRDFAQSAGLHYDTVRKMLPDAQAIARHYRQTLRHLERKPT